MTGRIALRQALRKETPFYGMPIKRRIFEYLQYRKEGADTKEIMSFAYMHDPDGGPEWGNTISVHVAQMNKMLADRGLRIVSNMGPEAIYRLVKVPTTTLSDSVQS